MPKKNWKNLGMIQHGNNSDSDMDITCPDMSLPFCFWGSQYVSDQSGLSHLSMYANGHPNNSQWFEKLDLHGLCSEFSYVGCFIGFLFLIRS
jgi:hypothetical protein